jgi:hypothetical protein
MATTVRRRRALVRGLRSTVFEVSVCVGALAALQWALKHPEHVARCAAAHKPASYVLQHCVSDTVATVAGHWILTVGAGALAGALVGVALAHLITMPLRA